MASMLHEQNMSTGHWWNDTDRETRSAGMKICPGVTVYMFLSLLLCLFGEGEEN